MGREVGGIVGGGVGFVAGLLEGMVCKYAFLGWFTLGISYSMMGVEDRR